MCCSYVLAAYRCDSNRRTLFRSGYAVASAANPAVPRRNTVRQSVNRGRVRLAQEWAGAEDTERKDSGEGGQDTGQPDGEASQLLRSHGHHCGPKPVHRPGAPVCCVMVFSCL